MFQALRLEVMERFTAVEHHFRQSRSFRGVPSLTAKGLVFVQVYAIHEFATRNVVRIAVAAIAAHSHTYASLSSSLLAMFLDAELNSLRDCGQDKIWDRRIGLLDRATSQDPVSAPGTPFPMDGTHFRHSHLNLILKVFGIRRTLTVRRRHLYKIDEVVDNRNFIAHGEKTADEVGQRYSRQDVNDVIRQMKSVCLRLIMLVSQHCDEAAGHCR
jgi:MAE_28990/MAE_18760-like HEPN